MIYLESRSMSVMAIVTTTTDMDDCSASLSIMLSMAKTVRKSFFRLLKLTRDGFRKCLFQLS